MKNALPIVLLAALTSQAAMADEVCLPESLDATIEKDGDAVRFAQFNAFLNRDNEGELIENLASNPAMQDQIRAVAEIIQRVRPDVLLLNEFDYDAAGEGIALFQENYLGVSQNGQAPIHYQYVFNAASNTGVPSGVDLNGDGSVGGPNDAFGFGFFPGQFGMVLLSRFPIDEKRSRTFQEFRWADMPDNVIPPDFYSDEALEVFRLSSKSHWDVVFKVGRQRVHVLAAHPTPPVFDGPEDSNGRRNFDEIRFWADYVGPRRDARYIYDDRGRHGGLRGRDPFVIMGDYNADPFDGDSFEQAILQLLEHPVIDSGMPPASFGGVEDSALEGLLNDSHAGNPGFDTADFNPAGPGNLRVDYVLPSRRGTEIACGGVFWPQRNEATRPLVGDGFPVVSSDHHLIWQDLELERGGDDDDDDYDD